MPTIRAQCRLPYMSGVPEDVTVSTFHFHTGLAVSAAELVEIEQRLEAAYALMGPFLSPYINRAACTVRMYNLDDPEPRVPLADVPLTVAATSQTGTLPFEVALVLSFRGDYVSGTPNARRRNRTYFGPLTSNTTTAASGLPPVPSSTVINAAQDFGHKLALIIAEPEVAWVGWSETDSVQFLITQLWVDNAWDTQRRRGIEATARNAEPVLQPIP